MVQSEIVVLYMIEIRFLHCMMSRDQNVTGWSSTSDYIEPRREIKSLSSAKPMQLDNEGDGVMERMKSGEYQRMTMLLDQGVSYTPFLFLVLSNCACTEDITWFKYGVLVHFCSCLLCVFFIVIVFVVLVVFLFVVFLGSC